MSYDHIARLPWPEMEGCFLLLSCHKTDKNCNGVRPVVSFLCIVGDIAAEWEPTNGPIQLWFRGGGEDHYTFPKIRSDCRGHWSQLSVEEEGLPGLANCGNYAGVFSVLRQWADRELPERESTDE